MTGKVWQFQGKKGEGVPGVPNVVTDKMITDWADEHKRLTKGLQDHGYKPDQVAAHMASHPHEQFKAARDNGLYKEGKADATAMPEGDLEPAEAVAETAPAADEGKRGKKK